MNYFFAECLFLSFVLLSCSSTQESQQNKQADIFYAKGSQELLSAEYTSALISLKKANDLRKNDSKILNNLGMAYYFKKDFSLAKKHLLEAMDVDQDNMDAKNNLASIYLEENNLPKAEALYLEISKILTYQNQFRVFYNLGIIQLKNNNQTKAIEYFESSLAAEPDYCSASYQLGLIYKKQKKFDTALEYFRTAAKGSCYQYPSPHYAQAITLLDIGQYNKAQEKFEFITKTFPKSEFATLAKQKLNLNTNNIIHDDDSNLNSMTLPTNALQQNINEHKNNNNSFKTPTF